MLLSFSLKLFEKLVSLNFACVIEFAEPAEMSKSLLKVLLADTENTSFLRSDL